MKAKAGLPDAASPPARTRNSNVPRPSYRTPVAMVTAASSNCWRCASSSAGAGATSTSFWRRRCTLHSLSHRWMAALPSPATCTSTWRARGMASST